MNDYCGYCHKDLDENACEHGYCSTACHPDVCLPCDPWPESLDAIARVNARHAAGHYTSPTTQPPF